MKILKISLFIFIIACIVTLFFFLGKVAAIELKSEKVIKQCTIESVFTTSDGPEDIIFKTKEDGSTMYINRGLEKYSLDYFQSRLLDKPAKFLVQYYKSGNGRVLAIECEGKEIYRY